MSKQAGSADEQMMRGAWEWAGEMGALHGVGIRLTVAPTKRPGVFTIKAQALEMVDGVPKAVRVQYRTEWPSAKHQTLAGALMGASMHLDHMLGIDALAAEGSKP